MFVRCLILLSGLTVFFFCCKDFVFGKLIFAPCDSGFFTYRLLYACGFTLRTGEIRLINIHLASQLMTHLSVSLYLALVAAFPYLMAEMWFFVRPALKVNERRAAAVTLLLFFFQFFLGIALAYFLIFPLTVQFLGNYQVSLQVENQISLSSYISTFVGLLFVMGVMFEMPIVAYFFARIGVLRYRLMRRWRKAAFVLALVAAAFITPSTDAFTMFLVSLPLWLLYEVSVAVVKRAENRFFSNVG